MTDRPILFSGPMVRALLAGTKTQTRRVGRMLPSVKMDDLDWDGPPGTIRTGRARKEHIASTFAVGDRLYVREAWRAGMARDGIAPRDLRPGSFVAYEADGPHDCEAVHGRFRQGMHMPRWASRLTLLVTEVRVQRLQEITTADALLEGVDVGLVDGMITKPNTRESYRQLWDHLNEARGYGWETNPWVVAVGFVVVYCNIDEAAK